VLVPLSVPGSDSATGGQPQHLDSMPCGVGPSTLATSLRVLPEESQGINDPPSSLSIAALSVAPGDFHAQHFAKPSEKSDGRAKDVWMWFWPVESKESPTPLKDDEPILSQRPKALAIACRLCWAKESWKAYKICDGVVSTLRNHLKSQHQSIYEGYQRMSAREAEQHQDKGQRTHEPFHLAGFFEHLLRWIAVDDQASGMFINISFSI
jgi:hypothetical protein